MCQVHLLLTIMRHANLAMLECVRDFAEFDRSSDEIIAEAAMSNPERIVVLVEGVTSTALQKLKATVVHLIQFLKSIYNKVKSFFVKFKKEKERLVQRDPRRS